MPARYKTFGPFTLSRTSGVVTRSDLKKMWSLVDNKGLANAIGVYIVAKQLKKLLVPIYVGMTEGGFKKRFEQHVAGRKSFVNLSGKDLRGDLKVFFIALVTPKTGAFRKANSGKGKILSIEALEFMLIGDCLRLNDSLLNTSKKILQKGINVPGYFNEGKGKRDESAAILARMLKVDL